MRTEFFARTLAFVATSLAAGCARSAEPGAPAPEGAQPPGGEEDGGGGQFGPPSEGGSTCKNLQCKQVQCAGGGKTTVSGTVLDPAGKNPLYNVAVYVPNATPDKITDGLTCDRCGTHYTG